MTLKMAVKQDPAIERWATMRENTHLYYKLTGKNVLIAIFLGLAFPAAIWTGSIMQFVFFLFFLLTYSIDIINSNSFFFFHFEI